MTRLAVWSGRLAGCPVGGAANIASGLEGSGYLRVQKRLIRGRFHVSLDVKLMNDGKLLCTASTGLSRLLSDDAPISIPGWELGSWLSGNGYNYPHSGTQGEVAPSAYVTPWVPHVCCLQI